MRKQHILLGLLGLTFAVVTVLLPISAQPPRPGKPTPGALGLPKFTPTEPQRTIDPATLEGMPRRNAAYVATAQALATSINLDDRSIQATLSALESQLPASPADVSSDELMEVIESLLETGSIVFDAETRSLTVTTAYTEAMLNRLADAAMTNYEDVTVDLLYGAIRVTVQDKDLSSRDAVVFTIELNAVDGAIEADIIAVRVNTTDVPDELVSNATDDVTELLEGLTNETLTAATSGNFELHYSVDEVRVMEDEILVVMTIPLE